MVLDRSAAAAPLPPCALGTSSPKPNAAGVDREDSAPENPEKCPGVGLDGSAHSTAPPEPAVCTRPAGMRVDQEGPVSMSTARLFELPGILVPNPWRGERDPKTLLKGSRPREYSAGVGGCRLSEFWVGSVRGNALGSPPSGILQEFAVEFVRLTPRGTVRGWQDGRHRLSRGSQSRERGKCLDMDSATSDSCTGSDRE